MFTCREEREFTVHEELRDERAGHLSSTDELLRQIAVSPVSRRNRTRPLLVRLSHGRWEDDAYLHRQTASPRRTSVPPRNTGDTAPSHLFCRRGHSSHLYIGAVASGTTQRSSMGNRDRSGVAESARPACFTELPTE